MGLIVGSLVLVAILIIINKCWCFWSRSKVCLVGKTAIVTGGASGIGYQTALALASKGCRVIIADVVNISQAVEEIIKETHNPNIVGKKVDLQSFKSVREFAKDILATEEKLNILICNAGIVEPRIKKWTEDGLLKIMQVNYFSHFLLTHLLLGLLKQSTPSRIIFTSSLIAYISDLTIDRLNPEKEYFSRFTYKFLGGCYSNSKLALVAAAKVLSKKLKGTGVTVNAVHPGAVKTQIYARGLASDINIPMILLTFFTFTWGKNSEEGAQTVIHLAQSDEVKNISGQIFVEGMRAPCPFQLTEDFCQKIWEKSVEYTKLEPQEIKC